MIPNKTHPAIKRILIFSLFILLIFIFSGAFYLYDQTQNNNFKIREDNLKKTNKILTDKVTELEKVGKPNLSPLIIYGDTRNGDTVHEKIVGEIARKSPIAVFHLGDMVNDGTKKEEWDTFENIIRNLKSNTNFYAILGNHEKNSNFFYDMFELPNNEQWYETKFGSTRFLILNTNADYSASSAQYKWLISALENKGTAIRHTFVITHHAPYGTGGHFGENENLQKILVPIFEKYKVTAVFSGHDHDYERSEINGIPYFVCGGGGAPLNKQEGTPAYVRKFISSYNYCEISMRENGLKISAYNENSEELDSITIGD